MHGLGKILFFFRNHISILLAKTYQINLKDPLPAGDRRFRCHLTSSGMERLLCTRRYICCCCAQSQILGSWFQSQNGFSWDICLEFLETFDPNNMFLQKSCKGRKKKKENKHNAELQRKPSPANSSNILYTR